MIILLTREWEISCVSTACHNLRDNEFDFKLLFRTINYNEQSKKIMRRNP